METQNTQLKTADESQIFVADEPQVFVDEVSIFQPNEMRISS